MARSFRILGSLGRGAFGEVHLTEIRTDEDFVQTLAVKWLHPEFSEDAELAGRLRDEARLLGLLDHPNVVRVQGLTRLDGRLAVLMEAIRGCDLSRKHLSPRSTAQVGTGVAEALHAAWTATPPGRTEPLRVVHRDIKPSNIMVTERGVVKVMDFGVARATFDAREAQTRSQQYGTARYMAPERWLEGVAEAPSDVFSLGVTLIELVRGEPLPRPRLSQQGFLEDITAALETVREPTLRQVVKGMVAFDPAERPTADAVAVALDSLELPGDTLRTWAAANPVAEAEATDKTGTVVVEQTGDTIALTGSIPPLPATEPLAPTETAAVVHKPDAPPAEDDRRVAVPYWAIGSAVLLLLIGLGLFLRPTSPSPVPEPVPEPVAANTKPAPAPEPTTPEPSEPEPPAPEPELIQPSPPEPAPTPTRPTPSAPAPAPEPPPEPDPVATVAVTFMVDAGLSVKTPLGSVQEGRGALMLPAEKNVRLEVAHPEQPFACTIPVGRAPATWRIRADRTCKVQ